MKTVGILGYGYVGKAMANFFKDHFRVVVYDIAFREPDFDIKQPPAELKLSLSIENFNEQKPDLVVSCLPTPMRDDGYCDTSIVKEVLSKVNCDLILIKSTIPPGTTLTLVNLLGKDIAFSPEYIGEGKYMIPFWKYPHPTDMKLHDFVIIGGVPFVAGQIMEFFKKVLGPNARYYRTDSTTAELCKYMENCWGATKVTFCNEFADIAKNFGVDYDELRELWLLDGRVERMHTAVFNDARGFSGKCYPKDVNALVAAVREDGYEPQVLAAVLAANKKFNLYNK
jgi:UDPglucose 6-dehydrogenase